MMMLILVMTVHPELIIDPMMALIMNQMASVMMVMMMMKMMDVLMI